jgi:nucleotide-binding universal stress UspA family protein
MLPPKLIMSPIDFSEHSDDALQTATALASTFGSELCLVHVVPAIPKLPPASAVFHEREYEDELHRQAQVRLDEIAGTIAKRGVKVRSVVGTANDVSSELLRIAEDNGVDLIVIATHGMTGWHKLAFGSVAEKVVRVANCPVLVLRAQAESESRRVATRASAAVSR